MTRRPLVLACISAAVLMIVTVSDWPWGVLHEFWSENGMVTNIVASLVFILVGVTVLDQWQARRNAAQLRAVTLAAYHAVARIPLTQRRIMWVLVNGGEFRWDEDFTFTDQQEVRRRQVFARCGLPDVTVFDVRAGVEPVPALEERLSALIQDPEWLGLAYESLRSSNHGFRRILARWAPLLIAAEESSTMLVELSVQIEELSRLTSWFRPHATGEDGLLADATFDRLVGQWRRAFTNATAVEEALRMSLMVPGEANTYQERQLLEEPERAAMRRRRSSYRVHHP